MKRKEQEEEVEEETTEEEVEEETTEEEVEEETPKKKKDKWVVNLVITDEDKPPKKVFVKGEETLELYSFLADLRNEVETIKKGMLD